jgi:hypothetical protein
MTDEKLIKMMSASACSMELSLKDSLTSDILFVECDASAMLSTFDWNIRHDEQSRRLRVDAVGYILTGWSADANFQRAVAGVLHIN